jgi:phage I-like protein
MNESPTVLIFNRKLSLQPDGRIEVLRKGEYLHEETGLTQVVDDRALDDVLASFNRDVMKDNFGGILIDEDHFSYDTSKSSQAMGWIQKLERVGDSLIGSAELSDIGRPAVEGKRFKYQSPVLDHTTIGKNRVRPTRLDTLAFTNAPVMKNLAAIALLNRSASGGSQTNNQGAEMKNLLIPLLGLPADAADSAVVEAVTQIKNRSVSQETSIADLRKNADAQKAELETLRTAQVDSDLKEFSGVIEDVEGVKKQLLANRDGTLLILRGLKKPEAARPDPKKPLHNRQNAATPEGKEAAEALKKDEQRVTRIKNRATALQVEAKRDGKRLAHTVAWGQATREIDSEEAEK